MASEGRRAALAGESVIERVGWVVTAMIGVRKEGKETIYVQRTIVITIGCLSRNSHKG